VLDIQRSLHNQSYATPMGKYFPVVKYSNISHRNAPGWGKFRVVFTFPFVSTVFMIADIFFATFLEKRVLAYK
jgi:hypothetical protein